MSGIWVAVNATTSTPGSSRYIRLKSWKSRPAAPRMTTRSRDCPEAVALMASLRRGWVDHGVRDPPLGCYAGATEPGSGRDVRRTPRRGVLGHDRREPLGQGLPRCPEHLARRDHLVQQGLLLGGQSVGGVPTQPRAEHLRGGLGVELHA